MGGANPQGLVPAAVAMEKTVMMATEVAVARAMAMALAMALACCSYFRLSL